jgi:hypothetical protein
MAESLFSNPIRKVKAISESSSTIRILLYCCRLNDDREGDNGDDGDDGDEGVVVDYDDNDWFVSPFSVSLTSDNLWLDSRLLTADDLDIFRPLIGYPQSLKYSKKHPAETPIL